mmetsp:Transcript_5556/g.21005  ORF Transcript_5556/g.21005 Transcript_5556/m.21005 type:complete len:201 (+) Transcript_5556:1246-1848(+)
MNLKCARVISARATSVRSTTCVLPWCTNCVSRATTAGVASASPRNAISQIALMALFAMLTSTSLVYSPSSSHISYVFLWSATAMSISIFKRFTAGASLTRVKKLLYSVANSGGALCTNKCRCAHTAYAGSCWSVCARVSKGALTFSKTCWCTSGNSNVAFKKHFTVANTTAEFECCSRSSRAFITSKVSVLLAHLYRAHS